MKNVLIIGATSAIAQAVAHRFAAKDSRLILWARSPEKLEIVAADLRVRHRATVFTESFDFDDFSRYETALQNALESIDGELDIALICHGHLGDQKASEANFRVAEQELRINCLSPISFLTLLANHFEQKGRGTLAVISSVAGNRGRQSNYVYGTAKAALNTFTEGLRNRLFPKGVHVLTIKPGFVDTPMTAHLKKGPLFVSSDRVAADILSAIEKRQCTVYTPWFWHWIMLIIRLVPEPIFRCLKL